MPLFNLDTEGQYAFILLITNLLIQVSCLVSINARFRCQSTRHLADLCNKIETGEKVRDTGGKCSEQELKGKRSRDNRNRWETNKESKGGWHLRSEQKCNHPHQYDSTAITRSLELRSHCLLSLLTELSISDFDRDESLVHSNLIKAKGNSKVQ